MVSGTRCRITAPIVEGFSGRSTLPAGSGTGATPGIPKPAALLASQCEEIEEMLWISLRMFEERKNLLTSIAKTAVHRSFKASTLQRLGETQGHIDRIRGMLLAPQSDGPEDMLTRVKGA